MDTNGNQINIPHDDLKRLVFLPFIRNITRSIINADSGDGNGRLILSGKYGLDPYFVETLLYDTEGNSMQDLYFIEESHYVLCSGAVSSAMRLHDVQIPFGFTIADNSHEKYFKKDVADKYDDFDFIVGIG